MNIHAPIPTGSGAYVLHRQLADALPGYRLRPYSPWWSLLPPTLAGFSSASAALVHSCADYGALFKRPGVPLVTTLHNYVCDRQMKPFASRLQYLHYRTDLRWLSRKTLQVSDRVTAVSHYLAHKVAEDMDAGCNIEVIYNGVDEQRFQPVPARVRPAPAPLKILFSGNLNRRKRANLLVPLANRLGPGYEVYYTQGLSNTVLPTAGLQRNAAPLIGVGAVAYPDMPELYQRMDVLFMPSAREGFGLCVAEAMACGLPVVAADAAALPELVVDGQGGYLFPVDDLDACEQAIRKLATDRDEAVRMGQFNRARVEQLFTLQRMVNDYQRLFEQVLDESPRG